MKNEELLAWVMLVASQTAPSRIHWCDGSDAEFQGLCEQMLTDRVLWRLNSPKFPGCFLHRSDPTDAVPLEHRRFVCAPRRQDVGPTNQWMSEEEAYRTVWPLFANAMKGRTLYVAPYLLGPLGSRYAHVGVQLTDSPLAVAKLRLLARMGRSAMDHLGRSGAFVRGLHCAAERRAKERYIVHFPAMQTSWSIGSEQTDSAVFGHKWHTLNMASALAPEEGFLAEHMSVARVTSPSGREQHIAAAFPSGCGKTRFATLVSTLPGWTVELVADGTCFLHVGDDGRLWALNLAGGIDDVLPRDDGRPDSGEHTVPDREAIFTNAALRADGTPWWEGCDWIPRAGVVDWQGKPWEPTSSSPAAHPHARFSVSAAHCRGLHRSFHDPEGVPLSAIVFGGRRSNLTPLIFEATSWEHGVYVGATSRSEAGPGALTEPGALRNDPMAMLPYCAYNMADYFGHWLRLGRQLRVRPRIFHVNWFRTDDGGKLLWPGFDDNVRVIQWIVSRVERSCDARRTPIGFIPMSLETGGLELQPEALDRLLQVDNGAWLEEAAVSSDFLSRFGERLPAALLREHHALVRRLRDATN